MYLFATAHFGSDNARGAENQQERLEIQMDLENPQRPYAGPLLSTLEEDEMVRHPRRRGGLGVLQFLSRNGQNRQSEIPCRVSSDLHEWRNDLGAVSTRDSAKLHDE